MKLPRLGFDPVKEFLYLLRGKYKSGIKETLMIHSDRIAKAEALANEALARITLVERTARGYGWILPESELEGIDLEYGGNNLVDLRTAGSNSISMGDIPNNSGSSSAS